MSCLDPNIIALQAVPPPGSIVTSLHMNDVLCGRGSGPNDHIGNINFRDIIALRRETYLTTSSRVVKAHTATEILNYVRGKNPSGRFLERVAGKGKNNPMWVVVEEDKAMEKIKQALRQIRNRTTTTTIQPKDTENTENTEKNNVLVDVDVPTQIFSKKPTGNEMSPPLRCISLNEPASPVSIPFLPGDVPSSTHVPVPIYSKSHLSSQHNQHINMESSWSAHNVNVSNSNDLFFVTPSAITKAISKHTRS